MKWMRIVFGFMYEMDAKRSHELVLKDKETVIYNEKTGEMKKI
jgi:hypothetical protein